LGVRTKSAVTDQEVLAAQVRTELVEKLNVVRTLGVGDKIHDGTAAQRSNADQAKKRKTAAWLLLGFLRVNCLIGWSIWHRESSSINDFDRVSMPQRVGGHALLGQTDSMAENVCEPFQRQAQARLAIGRGIVRKGALETLSLSRGLNLAQRLPAGSTGVEHLPKEAQKGAGKGEVTLAAMWPLL
jgi:hypothetical protein